MRHAHALQDEIAYVLAGHPTLRWNAGELPCPGMCAGVRAGDGNTHCIVDLTDERAAHREVGHRGSGDISSGPDDDLVAVEHADAWRFRRKDGTPW
ncbi:hypothetical protein [Dokdonella sp.]|uniref:hypothetical protein n=1 Tax=Dokdonella sp. TaxID=2291710 RepID=UPI0039C8739F